MAVLVLLYMAASCVMAMASMTCDNTTTMGTKFIFAIPKANAGFNKLAIHISSRSTAHVTVEIPSLHSFDSYTVNTHIIVNVSSSIENTSNGTSHKAIIISSDIPCSVTVLTHHSIDAVEGFLALPVTALSTRYIVSSYKPYSPHSEKSEYLVVAVVNNTIVQHSLYDGGRYLTNFTTSLNQYDVYQYMSTNDLSGTVITSNKPITVISGVTAAEIPVGIGDFQHMVEQLIPVKYWGQTFIVPNLYPRQGYYVRVYSNETNITAMAYADNSTANLNIDIHQLSELRITNRKPTVITSPEGVSVMQYGDDGSDGNYGDPFMTTVQAMTQYQSRYDFVTDFLPFGGNIWNVTLAVTALTSDVADILLDNKRVFSNSGVKVQVSPPFDNCTVVFLNITHTKFGMYHTLMHPSGHRFGAMIYSFPYNSAAYGYPLHLQLTNEACWRTTTTSTSTTTTTTTTSTLTTTTTSPTNTTPSPTTTVSENTTTGTMQCFNCRDIPHLKYCDHVTTCSSNEICYVEKYNSISGELLYRSGCINRKVCSPVDGHTDCLECCESGDFCNMKGCGDQGINTVSVMGPYCFDCNHVGEADECHSVQVCPQDQVCMIAKYVWGPNDFNYAMGCVHSNACQRTKRTVDEQVSNKKLNVRHLPACTHCCTSDFCNRNCSQTNHEVLIG